MTTDEKLVVIARAILEIEQKAVRTWDNDGEDAYGAGEDGGVLECGVGHHVPAAYSVRIHKLGPPNRLCSRHRLPRHRRSEAMSSELAPCPFCGGHPVTTEAMGEHWISCGTCTASATMKGKLKAACDAWNRRTLPAMSADHSPDADKMAHVLRGMVNRGTLIDVEAIDRALTLAVYRQDPDDDDRAWAASQAEVIGQPVVPVGSGDATNMVALVEAVACQKCGGEVQGWTCQGCAQGFRENDGGALIFDTHPPQPDAQGWRDIATAPRDGTVFLARRGDWAPFECQWHGEQFVHMDPEEGPISYKPDQWQSLNICRNCNGFGFLDTASPPPSADTGELREKVARLIGAADGVRWDGRTVTYVNAGADDEGPTERYFRAADTILDLIQSERVG